MARTITDPQEAALELEDPENYVRSRHADKEIVLEKSILPDGTVIIDLDLSGGRQRYSFTEI